MDEYSYNIRGWLTDINSSTSLDDHYFGLELYYDDVADLGPITKESRYNGNIAGCSWRSRSSTGTGTTKAYSYFYDDLNRLTNAYYHSNYSTANSYKVTDIQYDKNGNITHLKRWADGYKIDELIYSYSYNNITNNQLYAVHDIGNDNKGFKDVSGGPNEYWYDRNKYY